MPSFPDSVKSFTAKSAGQNIDPAHVNDIQDEVNAIEAGYRNGTAPLNSSGSTLTRLHVTGASTFASGLQSSNSTLTALQVSSNSTFAIRPTMPPPDMVRATSTSLNGFANATTLALTFNADDVILTNSSMHSTATNSERVIPQSTGVYEVAVQVEVFSAFSASTGSFSAIVEDSSAGVIALGLTNAITGFSPRINLTGYKRFDAVGATSWLRAVGAFKDGSTNSLTTNSWIALRKL